MDQAQKILLCDHRGQGFGAVLAGLRAAGWDVAESGRLEDTAQSLASLQPDLVLLDPLIEGGSSEVQLVRQASGTTPPALLYQVEGAWREEALAALRENELQFDLVPRHATPGEIVWRAERLLAQRRSGLEVEELRRRALFDERTELLRPKAFEQRLVEHFAAAERHHFPLALVILDLDHFGEFNKRRDHTFGDLVIARVGGVIRRNLRTEDAAGRLGGDEFAVVLPYTGAVEAAKVVRRMRDEIAALNGPLLGASGGLSIAASLGFETFDGGDLDSVGTLRAHAERALRAAKEAGGDRGMYYRSLARD
ncbi:MAG: GGDEF domain-containing protein [Planctomycetes bacterium]|nr:GGDEF domain-containing protein [Planctomycetota bacterium]